MDFAYTSEQTMIAETATQFFADAATSGRTRAAMASPAGYDRDLWRAFTRELGLAGVALPENYGGAGLGFVELAILAEAAGSRVAALPFIASLCMAAPAILAGGSPDQCAEWLPRLASGELIGTLAAMTAAGEPGDSDVRLDSGRLSGSAHFVPHGAAANLFLIAANGGMVAVEGAAAGLTVTSLVTMDQTRPYARLDFSAVAATPLADGQAALHAGLSTAWLALAADALGGAQSCLDSTVAYAKQRIQFGRPIGSFQAVKHLLADMMVGIEQARSAVCWAACAADERSSDTSLAIHAAKAFTTETYGFCAASAIQLHGGIGFTWEHDAHLFFKRARADATLLGAPSWHRERVARLAGLDEAIQ